jgi:pimeloyl-ACP methyl ester carboxylesterase
MKKRKNKILPVLSISLIALLVLTQSSMKMRVSDEKAQKEFTEAGIKLKLSTATIDGQQIHLVQTGIDTAATLFFIHGSPGSWDAFGSYLKDKDLSAKYRLISIDRPGFGYINFGKGMSISKQCVFIGGLIKQLQNGKPFYIVGHSLGGPICVKLAANYQPYINGAVLLAASVDPNEEKPERWRPLIKIPPFRWFIPGAFRPSNDELWYFKKDVLTMPSDLYSIKCPVTIIQGLLDPMVPPGNAFYAQKQLTSSRKVKLVTIPDANHFIPWTRFELIKNVLLTITDSMNYPH